MKNVLPDWLYAQICEKFDEKHINEIRLRANQPVIVNYRGEFVELKNDFGQVVTSNKSMIDYVVMAATKQSFYAYSDQIKNGYIVSENGLRIGLAGEIVYKNQEVSTIKNILSLNIRIAHQINGCSQNILHLLSENGLIKNTLIISPPGAGKTTMLRDLIYNMSEKKNIQNILVVDERFELAGINHNFNLGKNVDVVSGSKKDYAFYNAIKVMNPTVIVTDEISEKNDIDAIMFAAKSGVNVIATAHAKNLDDLKNKDCFETLIKKKYFERIVVLSKRNGVGTIECVYNENLLAIYLPFLI